MLYVSNNKVKDWAEVDRLAALPVLEELLFVGNPLHLDFKARDATAEYRAEVYSHSSVLAWLALCGTGRFEGCQQVGTHVYL